MTDHLDISASLPENLPVTPKKTDRKKKTKSKKIAYAERMAEYWKTGEEGLEPLSDLCIRLSEKFLIHKTACAAEQYMSDEEHEEMMHWLRRRLTFRVHDCDDGTRIFSDLFAIPLKGKPSDVVNYVLSDSFSEDMISLIRGSSMASDHSEFIFMRVPVPLIAAATFNLDILNSILNQLEWAAIGESGIQEFASSLSRNFRDTLKLGQESIVFGVRTVRLPETALIEDIFHIGLDHSLSENSYSNWGEMASEIGGKRGVFICMPDEITGAVAFLGASRVNSQLKREEDVLRNRMALTEFDSFDIHICETEEGLWISKTFLGYCIGPALVESDIVQGDHEAFMDNVAEDGDTVIYHEDYEDMPGLTSSGTLN